MGEAQWQNLLRCVTKGCWTVRGCRRPAGGIMQRLTSSTDLAGWDEWTGGLLDGWPPKSLLKEVESVIRIPWWQDNLKLCTHWRTWDLITSETSSQFEAPVPGSGCRRWAWRTLSSVSQCVAAERQIGIGDLLTGSETHWWGRASGLIFWGPGQ